MSIVRSPEPSCSGNRFEDGRLGGRTGRKGGRSNRCPAVCEMAGGGLEEAVQRSRWLCEKFSGILPQSVERLRAASVSYARWWRDEFPGLPRPSSILGEANVFRYRVRGPILVGAHNMNPEDVALVLLVHGPRELS